MTPQEKRDFGYAVLTLFLEGKISKLELNSFHLDLYARLKGYRPLYGVYYKSDDSIILRDDVSYRELLIALFHESYHRLDKDEDKARIFSQMKVDEWLSMSDREKRQRVVKGILSLKKG
jgi:hypothetical protein